MKRAILVQGLILLLTLSGAVRAQDLVQVHQDFSSDPGWEATNNRQVAQDPPTIVQDFGWVNTNHTGASQAGEIGGRVWQSRTPAYYAIPLNKPLSFKDRFSFSCRVSFPPTGGAGVAYLGFFNHQLQGWRVWNSMALRLGGESSGQAAIGADAMTAKWGGAGGTEGYLHVPQDGKPHTLRFSYDPDLEQDPWPDPRLAKHLTTKRQSTEEILEKARKDEPNLTLEELNKRLVDAHAAGLVYYLQRTNHESIIGHTAKTGIYWGARDEKERLTPEQRQQGAQPRSMRKGAMMIQLDDGPTFKVFTDRQAQDDPVFMDRFGLFNLQMYHQFLDLYLSDLTVNDHHIDLSKDPAWEGQGNRVRFVEQDFQRENFGFSETNWAGEAMGEVGGVFSSLEPEELYQGHYVDDVGKLTLDDPISFSGSTCFVQDSTDAGMLIGFFNEQSLTTRPTEYAGGQLIPNSLAILVEGGARGGKHFNPQFVPASKADFARKTGPSFLPTRERHAFEFDYDPKANNNLGRITLTVDGQTCTVELTEKQRKGGTVFDRFGAANIRGGGKYVEVYFDDLTYTARRSNDYQPVFHKQQVTNVPYPQGGRAF